MDLFEMLSETNSAYNADRITHCIGDNEKYFEQLMQILFTENPSIQLRASWVVTRITDKYPHLLIPYVKRIIQHLPLFKHTGICRNLLRQLATIPIPKSLQGKLFDISYGWLKSMEQPIAVRANCMEILYQLSIQEPDLQAELKLLMEDKVNDPSPGIRSRCQRILKKLEK